MDTNGSGLFLIPELLALVFDHIDAPQTLLNCACVNSEWHELAIQRLYKGSLTDTRFITPQIPWLDSLLIASRPRFVKNLRHAEHLQIASSRAGSLQHPWDSVEHCRVLRRQSDAKMLFSSQETGRLKSLSIPFHLAQNNFDMYSDFLFPNSLRVLVLEHQYCFQLLAELEAAAALNEKLLPQLIGLSIYFSSGPNPRELWSVIELIRPRVLNLIGNGRARVFEDDSEVNYTSKLCKMSQLQALSLDVHDEPLLAEAIAEMSESDFETCWPDLKALAVYGDSRKWLERLGGERRLQILRLDGYELDFSYMEFANPYLTVLEACVESTDNGVFLVHIAKQFPTLKYLDIAVSSEPIGFKTDPMIVTELLKALPQIEVLLVKGNLFFTGSHLLDIHEHCPRLRHLCWERSIATVSYEWLLEARPLPKLVEFDFESIHFPNSKHFLEDPWLQLLVNAWLRVFPNLRGMPCSGAGYVSIQGEIALEPIPDFVLEPMEEEFDPNDYADDESISWYLRARMWHRLEFSVQEWASRRQEGSMALMRNRWLKEYEENLLGCPIRMHFSELERT